MLANRSTLPNATGGRDMRRIGQIETGAERRWDASELADALALFQTITLPEMTRVALMDRAEQKYVASASILPGLLRELSEQYRVLVIEGKRQSRYRTLYYDTADFALYRRHHDGAPDRYKIRAREYVESREMFFEIKHRTPNRRTEKRRIPLPGPLPAIDPQLTEPAAAFVTTASPYPARDLRPALWNDYTRITLVSISRPERVTLDLDLSFSWEQTQVALPGVLVAEVKYNGSVYGSPFVAAMRSRGLRSASFSKYCVGIGLVYPEAKRNKFKGKRLLLERLMRENL